MKRITLLILALIAFAALTFAQANKFQLTSHILNISTGKPASAVTITLSKQDKSDRWIKIDEKLTDANGRINNFLPQDGKDNTGIYKLTFHTSPYFKALGQRSFYPFIEVVFELQDNEHYHVPITLSAFGYATYRGS